MTYREAAARLGLTPEAVAARARRQKWPRQPGNKPTDPTRIRVPDDVLAQAQQSPDVAPTAPIASLAPDHQAEAFKALSAAVDSLRAELEAQRQDARHQVEVEREERREAQRQLDAVRQQLVEAQASAALKGQTVEEQTRQIKDLAGALEKVRGYLDQAEEELERMKAELEQARRRHWWWPF